MRLMRLSFPCPECRKPLIFDKELACEDVACEECGSPFRMPSRVWVWQRLIGRAMGVLIVVSLVAGFLPDGQSMPGSVGAGLGAPPRSSSEWEHVPQTARALTLPLLVGLVGFAALWVLERRKRPGDRPFRLFRLRPFPLLATSLVLFLVAWGVGFYIPVLLHYGR